MLNFVQKWRELAPLYFNATAPFFYLWTTATCATFFSSRQWRGGAKSGASAQHCLILTNSRVIYIAKCKEKIVYALRN